MSDNAEEGIARTQAAAARAQGTEGKLLQQHQARSIAYIDERILIFVLAIAVLGLMVLWATSTSPWLHYGSFAVVIGLVLLWGYARIKRIERVRQQRAREAESWTSDS